MKNYGKNGSYFTTHINDKITGVEVSSGSLGLTLSHATGIALAAKVLKKKFKCIVILSDGELNEGSNWESFLFAPHHGLDNLICIVDYNKIQSFGRVSEILELEPLYEKFKSFNWDVFEINGHDISWKH